MAIQSKTTLKTHFVSNATPDEAEFGHLIDSNLNLAEEGTQICVGTISASALLANSYNLEAITIENIGSNDLTGSNQFGTSSLHIQSFSGSFHQSGGATSYFLNNLAIGATTSHQDNQGGLVISKQKTIAFSDHPVSQSMSSSLLIYNTDTNKLAFDSNQIHQYGSDLYITAQGNETTDGNIEFRTGNTNTSIIGSKTLFLSSSGDVSVGTTAPEAKFHVSQSAALLAIAASSGQRDVAHLLSSVTTAGLKIQDKDTINTGGNYNGIYIKENDLQLITSKSVALSIDKENNITASADFSASGLLYASASDANGTNYHTLLVDTASGRFYHTGSYGGGGGTGTTVVANPSGTPTSDLTKITIAGTSYNIPTSYLSTDSGPGISIGDTTLNVGIGGVSTSNHQLMVYGNGVFQGDVVAYYTSDKRLKDNIKPIEDPIGKIKQIGGYSFDWNDKQNTYEGTDFGVIAQEIEQVLPSLVQTREDGFKGVKYDKIVSLLIEAVKDQQKQIDELKKLI